MKHLRLKLMDLAHKVRETDPHHERESGSPQGTFFRSRGQIYQVLAAALSSAYLSAGVATHCDVPRRLLMKQGTSLDFYFDQIIFSFRMKERQP